MLLTIEKLVYGGDGLARLPAGQTPSDHSPSEHTASEGYGRGKAVFVPFTLGGEEVEASLTEEKAGFARARIEKIVEASPHRVEPQCRYFERCGGCHYQHASYEHQLEIKKEILRENLRRIAKLELPCEIEVHPSPAWNYRNRSRLQVRTQASFAAGYFKHNSHEVEPVEQCPISSPLVNRGIAALWKLGREGRVPEGVREVEFFADAEDTRLLVEISCAADARRSVLRSFGEELRAALPEIIGVVVLRDGPAKKGTKQETLLSLGESSLSYRAGRAVYRVSAGAFFQTNRHLVDELVRIVTQGRSGELALDLYSGVGLFSTALGDFHHVVSVESSQTAAADLAYNLPETGEMVEATTEEFLNAGGKRGVKGGLPGGKRDVRIQSDRKPDLVVVDPPRSGLGERVTRALASLGAPRVTYVSCDPATLARDLVTLVAAGYRVDEAHLVDLFPQTYHLESVLQLVR